MTTVIKKCWLCLFYLTLCTACSTAIQPDLSPTPTITAFTTSGVNVPTPISASPSTEEYLLSRIPHCDGIRIVENPIEFDWPNIDDTIQELQGSLWGYYSCERPQAEVSQDYREQMPKPPYNMQETNWLERKEGTVGVYYNSSHQWDYLWVVPQPEDLEKSYVIVAQSYELIRCQ